MVIGDQGAVNIQSGLPFETVPNITYCETWIWVRCSRVLIKLTFETALSLVVVLVDRLDRPLATEGSDLAVQAPPQLLHDLRGVRVPVDLKSDRAQFRD